MPDGASSRPAQWTLYSRPDCSLCDELLAELVQLLPPQDVQRIRIVDISLDPVLERRYAIRIPVLMADEEFVCAYRLDVERVRAYLG
ncbi:hypothetical protein ACG33_09395 [Steroidobacter denitrificans]|uniref:Glutaredoxin n=1 Tax=Steroidobacter denitrificans TaxID=465721 RepID=A0A127FA60_STEDE|nr:hypothetical protein ACG33_09395 [Steroidobacter denitrificans]